MKKYAFIDFFKGSGILGIIALHTYQLSNQRFPEHIHYLFSYLTYGNVQVFFLISGFTIFISASHRLNLQSSSLLNFYGRRFFRLAPLYYFTIFVYFLQALSEIHAKPAVGTFGSVLTNLTMLQGLVPRYQAVDVLVPGGWTISNGVLFYLLVPCLVKRVRKLGQAIALFFLLMGLRVMLNGIFHFFPPIASVSTWYKYLYYYLPNHLPAYSLGIILYFLIHRKEWDLNAMRAFTVCLLLISLVQFLLGVDFLLPLHLIVALVYSGFFFLAGKKIEHFRYPALILYIGRISYSLLVSHFIIINLIIRYNWFIELPNPLWAFLGRYALILAISIPVASLLYHLIEMRGKQWGYRWLEGQTAGIVTATEVSK